jgi:hypothetical protein
MSINIEVGGATANSYVSVASADAYFNARENSDGWTDLLGASTGTLSATSRKENLLKQATREIDRSFRFHSHKYETAAKGNTNYQNLEFPRRNTLDDSGDTIIPDEVKFATYEQALWLRERAGKRTNSDGVVAEKQFIGDECFDYLKDWINRQIKPCGKYAWQGSQF